MQHAAARHTSVVQDPSLLVLPESGMPRLPRQLVLHTCFCLSITVGSKFLPPAGTLTKLQHLSQTVEPKPNSSSAARCPFAPIAWWWRCDEVAASLLPQW